MLITSTKFSATSNHHPRTRVECRGSVGRMGICASKTPSTGAVERVTIKIEDERGERTYRIELSSEEAWRIARLMNESTHVTIPVHPTDPMTEGWKS